MKFSKKIFFLIYALLLSAVLTACAAPAPDVNAGVYTCVELSDGEESYPAGEIYPVGCSLELMSGGEAVLSINGSPIAASWQLDGEKLSLDAAGLIYGGSLSEGCIQIELAEGLLHSFLLSGAEMEEKGIDGQADREHEARGMELYGFWRVHEAEGDWAQLSGQSFDLFGRVEPGEDGMSSLVLWDERLSYAEPMARLELSTPFGEEGLDTAELTGGWFWLMEVDGGSWSFSSAAPDIPGLIYLDKAQYKSEEGSFSFSLCLRPWAWLWDDVAAADPSMLPYWYYDWYLPLVENSGSMPDSFEAPASGNEADIIN